MITFYNIRFFSAFLFLFLVSCRKDVSIVQGQNFEKENPTIGKPKCRTGQFVNSDSFFQSLEEIDTLDNNSSPLLDTGIIQIKDDNLILPLLISASCPISLIWNGIWPIKVIYFENCYSGPTEAIASFGNFCFDISSIKGTFPQKDSINIIIHFFGSNNSYDKEIPYVFNH